MPRRPSAPLRARRPAARARHRARGDPSPPLLAGSPAGPGPSSSVEVVPRTPDDAPDAIPPGADGDRIRRGGRILLGLPSAPACPKVPGHGRPGRDLAARIRRIRAGRIRRTPMRSSRARLVETSGPRWAGLIGRAAPSSGRAGPRAAAPGDRSIREPRCRGLDGTGRSSTPEGAWSLGHAAGWRPAVSRSSPTAAPRPSSTPCAMVGSPPSHASTWAPPYGGTTGRPPRRSATPDARAGSSPGPRGAGRPASSPGRHARIRTARRSGRRATGSGPVRRRGDDDGTGRSAVPKARGGPRGGTRGPSPRRVEVAQEPQPMQATQPARRTETTVLRRRRRRTRGLSRRLGRGPQTLDPGSGRPGPADGARGPSVGTGHPAGDRLAGTWSGPGVERPPPGSGLGFPNEGPAGRLGARRHSPTRPPERRRRRGAGAVRGAGRARSRDPRVEGAGAAPRRGIAPGPTRLRGGLPATARSDRSGRAGGVRASMAGLGARRFVPCRSP